MTGVQTCALPISQNCISIGAQSITRGSRLILNQAFPRMLLPYSSALSAVRQFLPTLPIYIAIVVIGKFLFPNANLPGWHFNYLIIPIVLICLAATSFGLALFFATLNVYFRDTTKLLNYILRIWLYACPVLWLPEVLDRKSTRLNSSHIPLSRMPSSA